MADDVQILENFCRELYTTQDATVRSRAEVSVIELAKNPQCLEKCILLFQRANSAYSQVLAATTLQKLIAGGGTLSSQVASTCQQLSGKQKLELRNFIIDYLWKHASAERFVTQSIVKLLALLTKYGWLEQDGSYADARNAAAKHGDKIQDLLMNGRVTAKDSSSTVGFKMPTNGLQKSPVGSPTLSRIPKPVRSASSSSSTPMENNPETVAAAEAAKIALMYKRFPYRRIVEDVKEKYFNFETPGHTIEHATLGCQILIAVILEINKGTFVGTSRPLTKQRKVSSSFREKVLKEIFMLSRQYLHEALVNGVDEKKAPFLAAVFNMAKECLCFDFLGNGLDDTSDDQTVQLPTSWRELVLDGNIFDMFMQWYDKGLPDYMNQAVVCCLAQLAAIRRTLFTTVERQDHINRLIKGLLKMLEKSAPLNNPDTYHEFCRYLCRIKTTYQLNELVSSEDYQRWLEACVHFSISSFDAATVSPNSLHYLLIFWQKLATSTPYVRSEADHRVDKHAAQVVIAYVQSRLTAIKSQSLLNQSNSSVLQEGNDPFLDIDKNQREEQLESICQLARCQYHEVGRQVYQFLTTMRDTLKAHTFTPRDEDAVYRQCAWLIQVVATLIGTRVTSLATEESDKTDAELIKTAFEIIQIADAHTSQAAAGAPIFSDDAFQTNAEDLATDDVKGLLQLSIVYFFKHFKRIFIGEQMNKNCPVYQMLRQSYNLESETQVLNAIFEKILTNLKYQLPCLPVIEASLNLLNQLSQGYTTARQMATLDNMQQCLSHGLAQLPLISHWQEVPTWTNLQYTKHAAKHRRLLYLIFGRLLMAGFNQMSPNVSSLTASGQEQPMTEEYSFYQFVAPITQEFRELIVALQNNDDQKAKWLVVGIARALRGLAFALNSKAAFQILFQWLWSENRILALTEAAKRYHDEPLVIHSILKFYCEFSQNRAQRLTFDAASPSGVLLFRNISEICISYGEKLAQNPASLHDDKNKGQPPGDIYQNLLKGMNLLFRLVHTVLAANFVNFGMSRIYNDQALDKLLEMFLDLTVSKLGDCANLLAYPKCAETFYMLVEQLSDDHTEWLCNLDEPVLITFLVGLKSGIAALNSSVQTRSCGTLDNLVTLVYKQLKRKKVLESQPTEIKERLMLPEAPTSNLVQLLSKQPTILQQMLALALYHVLFEECKNQWSISRPLLPLILFNREYFNRLKDEVLVQNSNTAPDQEIAQKIQLDVEACFKKLMDGIDDSLDVRNRDKFTHSLTIFRREMTEAIRGNEEIWNTSAPSTFGDNSMLSHLFQNITAMPIYLHSGLGMSGYSIDLVAAHALNTDMI